MSKHSFKMDITFDCTHPNKTVFDSICLVRRAIKEMLDKYLDGDYDMTYKIDMEIIEKDSE